MYRFLSTATIEDESDVGGLKLGSYEKHQQKLRQERKEEYRKYLAEVFCEKKTESTFNVHFNLTLFNHNSVIFAPLSLIIRPRLLEKWITLYTG